MLSSGIIRYFYSNNNKHNINMHLDIIYFNTTVLIFCLNVITIFLPGNHPPFVFVCVFLYNRIIKYVTIIGHLISELMFLWWPAVLYFMSLIGK